MIFINLMLVKISFTHVFKVFNNISASSWAENGFKLKTGFDFRRSVSVRLTFWLQLYPQYTFSLPDSGNCYFFVFQNSCPNLTFTCPGQSGKLLCSILLLECFSSMDEK